MKSPCLHHRLWLLCIILISAFFTFNEARGRCLEHHKSLLLSFKRSLVINDEMRIPSKFTKLTNWIPSTGIHVKPSKLANWIPSTDCCLWPGVTCTGTYVTGLDLSNEGIVGGFNDTSPLFQLTSLTSLNLAKMYQETGIPSGIGRLVNLMHFNMSRSNLRGQIPIEISNLTKLVSLDLSYPSDSLPDYMHLPSVFVVDSLDLRILVGNLSNLIDLRLSRIDISESTEWCQVLSSSTPRLQVLELSHCKLSGSIHDSLQNLTRLSVVDISDNIFSGPVPYEVFLSLENLSSLTLGSCRFNGVFPHKILQIPNLRYLDLSTNYDLEASPSITLQNSSLETLLLSETRFSKTIPESIGEVRMLSTLDLWLCGLSGEIPKSISQLEHLVYLDLSSNNLDGHIPSFSRSSDLKELHMDHNQLEGSILTTDWKKLPHMTSLMLRSNSLSGSVPAYFFEAPSLLTLDLQENHFTGFASEPNVMASSSRLQEIYLCKNNFHGSFPPSIHGLDHLKVLDLSFNNFHGSFPPFIYGSNNLQVLDLSFNNFNDKFRMDSLIQLSSLGLASCNLKEFPPFLSNQSSLWNLDLSDNQIGGTIPDHIWNMSSLLNLNLSYNQLEFSGGEELGKRLEVLDLSSNQLRGKLPRIQQGIMYLDLSRNFFDSIIPLTIGSSIFNIGFFSLSSNKLHGSIPVSICNATTIELLDFSNNFLSGILPECLTQLPLGVLNLHKNDISGTIPDTFPSPCSLQTLDLSQNSFQGEIPKSLGGSGTLEALDLGYNKLHDRFPCWMNSISMLTVLILRSNLLYGNIECFNQHSNWTRLQIIDISSNNFVGKLPSRGLLGWEAMLVDKNASSDTVDLHYEIYDSWRSNTPEMYFRTMVSVTVKGHQWTWTKISSIYTLVDFSHNKFEGDIPHELGHLKYLYALNLSHNYLSGRIPTSFGNLSQIESLDLSENNLSGKIPTQLATLNFLSVLNLSFNHFDGMIPMGKQFQTFSEDSFKGNEGLCGQPLNTSCGNKGVNSPLNSSSEAEDEFGGVLIATEVGYALGFGLIIMPLLFWSRWRNVYYEWVDKALMNIFCCPSKKSPSTQKIIRRRN